MRITTTTLYEHPSLLPVDLAAESNERSQRSNRRDRQQSAAAAVAELLFQRAIQ